MARTLPFLPAAQLVARHAQPASGSPRVSDRRGQAPGRNVFVP